MTNKKPEANPDNVGKVLSVLEIDSDHWFESREDGLWFVERKVVGKGDDKKLVGIPTRLTFEPLEVEGFLEPIEGDNNRGLLVRVGGRQVCVLRDDVSRDNDVSGFLSSYGVIYDHAHKAKITRYLMLANPKRVIAYTRNGWQRNNAFIVGDKVINGEGYVLRTDSNMTKFDVRGDFERWKAGVLPLLHRKPGWVFGTLAGLASPLLHKLNINTGAILHIHGASSMGKTTALMAAASCWGRPDNEGCLKTFDSTINALEGLAEGGSDIGLQLDEMTKLRNRPELLRDSIYKLANGQGKGRMKTNADMQRQRWWRNVVLLSSELTIEDLFDAAGDAQATGQVVRAIDILGDPIFPMLPLDDVLEVERGLLTCYGVAGPEFVRRIAHMDDLSERHERARGRLYDGDDSRLQRVAGIFALLIVAGEIMEIDTLVVDDVFARWTGEDIVNALSADFQVARRVLDFIDSNLNSTIIPLATGEYDEDEGEGEAAYSSRERHGWFDEQHVYLLRPVVDKLRAGHGRNRFYEWLRRYDVVKVRSGDGVTTVVEKLAHRPLAIAFKLEALRDVVEVAEHQVSSD